eukprot:TRINITY_DN72931_c0_g1_i1.p1 TRINITY_DN72931_c0_g1~~TRINITY_DN72931_c0_g1_i1.p1  ORF type:complete len:884 (-),score=172.78 TRINITY_DN72931_c0_g1_i1:54-2705(-)
MTQLGFGRFVKKSSTFHNSSSAEATKVAEKLVQRARTSFSLETLDTGETSRHTNSSARERFEPCPHTHTSSFSSLVVDEGGEQDPHMERASTVRSGAYSEVFMGPMPGPRKFASNTLRNPYFDLFIGVIICANAVTIGLEQSVRSTETTQIRILNNIENVFLGVYFIELSLHLFVDPRRLYYNAWVAFDACIVSIGVLDVILTRSLLSDAESLKQMMILRMLRLLRLARTLRLVRQIHVLWMLVRGLIESISTMLYTMMLLFVILYVFCCVSMEIIATHPLADGADADPVFSDIVHRYFRNIPVTMLTLLQFVCLDSIGAIYKPLVEREPALIVYFIGVIIVVPVVILNLVTAVIVSGAINGAAKDKELQAQVEQLERKKLVNHLQMIFYKLDEDGSGCVSLDEFLSVSEQDLKTLVKLTGLTDPVELFRSIDLDDSGEIGIDEFCDGLWHIVVAKVPIETRRMEKRIAWLYRQVRLNTEAQTALMEAVGQLVACQQAFFDQHGEMDSHLEKTVNSMEQVLQHQEESKGPKHARKDRRIMTREMAGKQTHRVQGALAEASASLSSNGLGAYQGHVELPKWCEGFLIELKAAFRREMQKIEDQTVVERRMSATESTSMKSMKSSEKPGRSDLSPRLSVSGIRSMISSAFSEARSEKPNKATSSPSTSAELANGHSGAAAGAAVKLPMGRCADDVLLVTAASCVKQLGTATEDVQLNGSAKAQAATGDVSNGAAIGNGFERQVSWTPSVKDVPQTSNHNVSSAPCEVFTAESIAEDEAEETAFFEEPLLLQPSDEDLLPNMGLNGSPQGVVLAENGHAGGASLSYGRLRHQQQQPLGKSLHASPGGVLLEFKSPVDNHISNGHSTVLAKGLGLQLPDQEEHREAV